MEEKREDSCMELGEDKKKVWIPPKMETQKIYEMRALACGKCAHGGLPSFTPSCLFAPPGS